MMEQVNIKECVDDYFVKNDIYEFPAFCIARQGGRTALEILTRALILEGKYAYLGQNLTGLRGMGSNAFVIRFADRPEIPPGINVNRAKGFMIMHESLTSTKQGLGDLMSQMKRVEELKRFNRGILMVCTSKSPEELAETYPFPFQGTVATVDAEAIFSKHVGIQPAPSGITALGLFVAATGKLVKIESVKEATMAHERLNRKVREENLPCLVEAYETAQVVSDVIIEERKDLQKAANKSGGSGTKWGKKLPFTSNPSNCTCAECMSAYFCPEAAITWQDDVMHFDLDACKSCGTCAVECLHDAITMEKAEKVMDALVK